MYLILFNLSLLEIIILPASILILGCAIYFVYATRKSLRRMLDTYDRPVRPQQQQKAARQPVARQERSATRTMPAPNLKKSAVSWPEPLEYVAPAPAAAPSVAGLKETLFLQQQTLENLMQKVEELQGDTEGSQAFREENDELQGRIEELELALMRKEQELKAAKQQETVAQQMAGRIDEVYREFELLQNKIATLESQASRSSSLNLELEDMKQGYEQLHKDVLRKQDKIEELVGENRRLRSELSLTEEKLAEANVQRQQLMKRAKYLQDAQIESQSVSESQSKLQKELRRIGELESMLNLITEEREKGKGLGKK
jgi:myosin heavy subunit